MRPGGQPRGWRRDLAHRAAFLPRCGALPKARWLSQAAASGAALSQGNAGRADKRSDDLGLRPRPRSLSHGANGSGKGVPGPARLPLALTRQTSGERGQRGCETIRCPRRSAVHKCFCHKRREESVRRRKPILSQPQSPRASTAGVLAARRASRGCSAPDPDESPSEG